MVSCCCHPEQTAEPLGSWSCPPASLEQHKQTSHSILAWLGGRDGNGRAQSRRTPWLGQRPSLVALGRMTSLVALGQGDMALVKSLTESYTTLPLAVCAVRAAIDTAPAALRHPRGEQSPASGTNDSAREQGTCSAPPQSLGLLQWAAATHQHPTVPWLGCAVAEGQEGCGEQGEQGRHPPSCWENTVGKALHDPHPGTSRTQRPARRTQQIETWGM